MTHDVNLIDRLRIERVVWTLDQRLYDLPRSSRIAKRREVRQNVLAAAHDVGTPAALRQLGNGQQLAADYLAAEYGDEPRAHLTTAAVFLLTATFFLLPYLSEAANAFGQGVTAGDPNATGTFTWSGLSLIQSPVTFTFSDGVGQSTGGNLSPFGYHRAPRLDDPHRTTLATASDVAHARASHTKRPSHHRVSRAPAPEPDRS